MLRDLYRKKRAQSLLEYSILVALVVGALITMTPFMRRAIQGIIKVTADQIGSQKKSDQSFVFNEDGTGVLLDAYTATRASISKEREEFVGTTNFIYDDSTFTFSNQHLNLGFTEGRP